jgi:DNA-directed RNA polymerase specialized sigma subunit
MQYKYYFVRVANKQQADFPAYAEIDIDQRWNDILHELDKEEHAVNEYQRRLGNRTTKDATRFTKTILGPEEAFFQKELETRLAMAMMALTSRQQYLVEAIIIDGRKKTDVASELEISKATVGQQLIAAIKALKKNF